MKRQAREHRITVLLVDDQAMISEKVRRDLAAETDIDFHYCQDPTRALTVAREVRPTVILQDLVMPEIEGLMLVRFYRADPTLRDVPIIVLSTKEEPILKAQAFRDGANDYVVKIPDRLELVARIRYHSSGYIHLLERNERDEFILSVFARYSSSAIVTELLENPKGLEMGGTKRRITILMSDLRGFTATCERLAPEDVVRLLNKYLGTMAEVIQSFRGTVDEFIGDAILALFGAPLTLERHAAAAVDCAVAMQLAMVEVNEFNREQGLPEVEMGIAIDTGEVVVGNIGSEARAKYGIVGSHVNLTARIESYSVGGQILISDATFSEAGPDRLVVGDSIEVSAKGFRHPILAHDLLGLSGDTHVLLPRDQERFAPLSIEVPFRYVVLEGKQVGDEMLSGRLLRLSDRGAEVRVERPVERLTNLLIRLDGVDSDLYAKVIATRAEEPGPVLALRFTSIAPEIETLLGRLRNGG